MWIDGQQHAIGEDCFKAFDRAVLITASSGAAADTDGADHLAVDDDGKAAGIGEESELHQLPGIAARIIAQLPLRIEVSWRVCKAVCAFNMAV